MLPTRRLRPDCVTMTMLHRLALRARLDADVDAVVRLRGDLDVRRGRSTSSPSLRMLNAPFGMPYVGDLGEQALVDGERSTSHDGPSGFKAAASRRRVPRACKANECRQTFAARRRRALAGGGDLREVQPWGAQQRRDALRRSPAGMSFLGRLSAPCRRAEARKSSAS